MLIQYKLACKWISTWKAVSSSRRLDFSNYSVQSSFGSLEVKRCVVRAGAWTRGLWQQVSFCCHLFLLWDGSESGLHHNHSTNGLIRPVSQSCCCRQEGRLSPAHQVRGPPGADLCNAIVKQHGWVLSAVRRQRNTSGWAKKRSIRWSSRRYDGVRKDYTIFSTGLLAELKRFDW